MREADLLVHVVDVSHPNFEEQIEVVSNTLREVLGDENPPSLLVFNKIDAFTWEEKDEADLTPKSKRNISASELKEAWLSRLDDNCLFISAREGTGIDELKSLLYDRVKQIHITRFPYNDFLFQDFSILEE